MIEVTTNKKRTVEVFSTVLFYEGDMYGIWLRTNQTLFLINQAF